MIKLIAALAVGVATLFAATVALADPPPATTFVAVLTAEDEVPLCAPAGSDARGVAIFHVLDQATGLVSYKLVANNIPGNTTAAHIHLAPKGTPGGVVQPLPFPPGSEQGVIGRGTFTNPALLAAMRANPQNYYVNVHSSVCGPGVIRGQLDEHGPANN
jgi:CHRD domain-containing protein